MVVLTRAGGLVYAGTSGLENRVAVPFADNGTDVVIHHSHTGEDSLSAADFGVAWRRSRDSEVRASTLGGSTFRGRAVLSPDRWRGARERARSAAASELRVLGRRDDASYSYLASHLVNTEMAILGLIPIGTDPDLWSGSVRPADDRRRAVARAIGDELCSSPIGIIRYDADLSRSTERDLEALSSDIPGLRILICWRLKGDV